MNENDIPILVVVLTVVTIVIGLAAETPAQSPSKVLKQAENALGGRKALQSTRSVSKTGSIRRMSDGATGKITYQISQPNLLNLSYELNGFETEIGYNGRSGWQRNSRDGIQTLTGKASIDITTKAFFRNDLWLKYKDEKSKITSGGTAKIDGKDANIVILTTQKGVAIKLFFDAV